MPNRNLDGERTPRVVADVMTKGVAAAHLGAAFKQAAAALSGNRVSIIPVIDTGRKVVGVITSADLLARSAHSLGATPRGHRWDARAATHRKARALTAAELMTSPAITITASTTIAEAAEKAAHHRVKAMPVVDDDGILIGAVTRDDLVRVYLRADADIQRQIEDQVMANEMLLEPHSIRIDVSQGVVTLSGHLDRRLVVEQLVERVGELPGVVDVLDDLSWDRDHTAPAWRSY